jgi:hypothetical protein
LGKSEAAQEAFFKNFITLRLGKWIKRSIIAGTKTRTIDSFCTSPDAKKKTKAPEAAFLNWTNRRVRRAWLMD